MFSRCLIHCGLTVNSSQVSFLCTFVYGLNEIALYKIAEKALWRDLRSKAAKGTEAWCTGEDFNAIMRDERIMADCKLNDVKAIGRFFIWTNKQEGEHRSCQKLTDLWLMPAGMIFSLKLK